MFKSGDRITARIKGQGLEEAVVIDVVKKEGKKYYRLKIPCGTALLQTCADVNYKLVEDGNRESI